jgi:hypothetical protein
VVERSDTTGKSVKSESTLEGSQKRRQTLSATPAGVGSFSLITPVVSLRSTTG